MEFLELILKFLFLTLRICKKTKNHKSPDWSRLVRQKLDEWDGEYSLLISKKLDSMFNGKVLLLKRFSTRFNLLRDIFKQFTTNQSDLHINCTEDIYH